MPVSKSRLRCRSFLQVAKYQVNSHCTVMAATHRVVSGNFMLATASNNSEVQIHKDVVSAPSLAQPESESICATSAQLCAYQISAMVFHPSREQVLVATMDGSIHFLSTDDAFLGVSVECVNLPSLLSHALKAEIVIHPPDQSTRCNKSKACICAHAAQIRAKHADRSSKGMSRSADAHPSSSGDTPEALEAIQNVRNLEFISVTYSGSLNATQGDDAASPTQSIVPPGGSDDTSQCDYCLHRFLLCRS